ncbi:MAG: response regulator [Anaerovoracaceae bacterium]
MKSRLTSLFKSLVSGEEEPSEKPLNLLSESDFSGKRVLLVEDNDLNQEIAQEFCKMAGLTVEIAENGKEAVRLFSGMPENYYDMILMDIQMPLMNGYEAAEALRSMGARRCSECSDHRDDGERLCGRCAGGKECGDERAYR